MGWPRQETRCLVAAEVEDLVLGRPRREDAEPLAVEVEESVLEAATSGGRGDCHCSPNRGVGAWSGSVWKKRCLLRPRT